MTERALPGMDGAPACPFVAFGDDRDGRSTSPDHRHRCFAESPPAPRAVAHQEAYCLSSAFPVCPTFQDWAKREAAHARGAAERPEAAPSATPVDPSDEAEREDTPEPPAASVPPPEPVRRNPPRDWAAPPPWATGATGRPPGSSGAGDLAAADLLASKSVEGQGLAGSAADRLAGGPEPSVSAAAWSASSAGAASTAPDDDLAGLVQGRPSGAPAAKPASDGSPPPTRSGRRPAVSSTRPTGDPIPGPSWERMRRYEAYPTIRSRASLPGLPRIAVLAGAIGIAALALFMLPALLGIGGGGGAASPSPSAGRPSASASVVPTVRPGPTPQIYIVKKGDTMSKIAKNFGVSVEEIMAVNPEIKDPNKIALGQQIVIPAPSSGGASPAPSPKASAKASAAP